MERIAYYVLGVGAAFCAIAWIWLLIRAFKIHKAWGWCLLLFPPTLIFFFAFRSDRARRPMEMLLFGAVLVAAALVYPQLEQRFRTFGERERVVDGELHVTLTGWDKTDYSLLASRPDAVVVQMANADVTDATLEHLRGMNKLRELDLDNTSITDEGLAILAELPALESLRLGNTKISVEGFEKYLAGKESLMNLNLRGIEPPIPSKLLRTWKAEREGRRFLN